MKTVATYGEAFKDQARRHRRETDALAQVALRDPGLPDFARAVLGVTASPETLDRWRELRDKVSGAKGERLYAVACASPSGTRALGIITGGAVARLVLPSGERKARSGPVRGVYGVSLEVPVSPVAFRNGAGKITVADRGDITLAQARRGLGDGLRAEHVPDNAAPEAFAAVSYPLYGIGEDIDALRGCGGELQQLEYALERARELARTEEQVVII